MKKYEGNNYKFKKNSIYRIKNKYKTTYHYLLLNILYYKKYLTIYEEKENNKEELNNKIIEVIESIGNDFNISNNKIYTYFQFNKAILKQFHKVLKQEKKLKEKSNLIIINNYKLIKSKKYKELRKLSILNELDFLKAIYLYTISED